MLLSDDSKDIEYSTSLSPSEASSVFETLIFVKAESLLLLIFHPPILPSVELIIPEIFALEAYKLPS